LRSHPSLQGRIVTADEVKAEPASPAESWSSDDSTVIEPGDRVRFTVDAGQGPRTQTVVAVPRPPTEVPGVGPVQVVGRRLGDVREEIRRRLLRDVRRPEVTLALSRPPGICVLGRVKRPGRVPGAARVPVSLALAGANWFDPGADPSRVLVVRGSRVIVCDWDRYVLENDGRQDLALQAGDTVLALTRTEEGRVPPEWEAAARLADGRTTPEALETALRQR